MDSHSSTPSKDISVIEQGIGSETSQRNLRCAFLLFLISAVLGEIYLIFSQQMVDGLFSFYLGTNVLDTPFKGAYQIFGAHLIYFSSLLTGGISFLLLSRAFKPQNTDTKKNKLVRLGLVFISADSFMALTLLVVTIILGSSVENSSLSYPSTNILGNALFMLVYSIFLIYGIILSAGMLLGGLGGPLLAFKKFDRVEFLILAPLLFIGVILYPAGIAAGVFGLWGTTDYKYSIQRPFHAIVNCVVRLVNEEALTARISMAALVISSTILFVMVYLSYQVSLYVEGGVAYWYQSPLMFGPHWKLIFLGLIVTPPTILLSLHNLIKRQNKLVFLEGLTAIGIMALLLAIYILLIFYTPPAVASGLLVSWRNVMQQPVYLLTMGMLLGVLPMRFIKSAKARKVKIKGSEHI